jgi:hypothetical protein
MAALFRLPALVNAGGINSDAAIVGLQTRHMLAGEWSREIWRAPYQLPAESLLLLPFSALFGWHPFWIFLIPTLLMLAMIALVWHTLRSDLSPLATFACILPLVFATHAINSPMVYAMRQVMVTTVMLGVLCWHHARNHGLQAFALGGIFFAGGAVIDMFGLLLLPAGALLLGLCARDPASDAEATAPRKTWLTRAAAGGCGMLLSMLVAASLGHFPGFRRPPDGGRAAVTSVVAEAVTSDSAPSAGVHPVLTFASYTNEVAERATLLWEKCGPFALGAKAYLTGSELPAPEWYPPGPFRAFAATSALLFVLMLLAAAGLAYNPAIPRTLRRLGIFGLLCAVTAVAAFVFVAGASDMWSVRYLAPVLWFAPCALAPVVYRLGASRSVLLLGAWAVSAGICGWATYGTYVHGARVVRPEETLGTEERALAEALRARGIKAGYSDYWLAYRLSLLMHEDPVVVPFSGPADRYPPYRQQAEEAKVIALLFHPSEPRVTADGFRTRLVREGRLLEEFTVARYTVLIARQDSAFTRNF